MASSTSSTSSSTSSSASSPTTTTTPSAPPAIPGGKREGYLSWDEYFMSAAFLSSMRSKDPATQVGAVIVNAQRRIVGIGYNGMPSGCSDDGLPWGKTSENRWGSCLT